MSLRPKPAILVAALAAIVVAAAAVGWVSTRADVPSPPPTAAQPTTPPAEATTPPEIPALGIDLGRVSGSAVRGSLRPATLRVVADDVREVMTDLYETAFVDPERWDGGTFPSLTHAFAATARDAARADVGALTLGTLAGELEAVEATDADLDIKIVGDARGRPTLAFASMRFRAVGTSSSGDVPLRHDGTYVLRRSSAGWRITAYDVRGGARSSGEAERDGRAARLSPPIPSPGPTFVLVIGSDARPGSNPARALADSIHIVAVNPRVGRASILGIPRDSYVGIPGHGTDKINASLARGGPALVVETVERLTGVRIDGYILTGFAGFERIVDEIGPVDIDVPYAMNDRYSHARFRAGWTRLSPRDALAFSRNRHDAPGGDFGRSLNQGRLLIAFLAELRRDLESGDPTVLPWLMAGARHLETDLDLGQMADLLLAVREIAPREVHNRVVSGHGATIGGRSVVLLSAGAREMFRDLARDGVLGR